LGPIPEHVVSKKTAHDIFTDAGFAFESDFDAGEHHWALIFKKKLE
jgi:hypothetical protein